MNQRSVAKPHGQIRRSQVITTFGPGAMLDLPNHSVLVGGLEYWSKGGEEIHEPRLIGKLKTLLSVHELRLFTPPIDQDDPSAPPTGIRGWQFPEWFVTQDIQDSSRVAVRSRLLVHHKALIKGKFIDADKKRRPVVPVRFVRACHSGHINDIDWYGFVHNGKSDCRRQLWMDERGTSADLSEVWIRCDCNAERAMSDAAAVGALGSCNGARLWLGPHAQESCQELNRLLIRTASNAYFPQLLSVISLPDRDEVVAKAVDQVWENFLEYVETLSELKAERERKPPVRAALDGLTDKEVFAEIETRRDGRADEIKSVKQAELETLSASREEIGSDRPEGDFHASALDRKIWDRSWMKSIERIVLVHRLREVVALAGFTRFEAAGPNVEGDLDVGVQRADLARELTWLPAIENRGEGIFLQFRREDVEAWLLMPEVMQQQRAASSGYDRWAAEHPGTLRRFPGAAYLMLHSFSHLLITAIALECGYPASAIRERIYALPQVGYGMLLYTGTSDAEGTLGGLIEVGRRIHEHVRVALEMGELCSNDPVCAEHVPGSVHEQRYLHGAACHGCVLIAETSCEQHNDFLDRALVVRTVAGLGAEFFRTGRR
ncbi:DUF1998 domain-containing protein [soil metagenome]